MLEQEINEFGRRLGLPGLELCAEGLAALDIENVGKLTLERGEGDAEGDILMVLALEGVPDAGSSGLHYAKALRRCDWRSAQPFLVSTALVHERLIYAIRFAADSATAVELENGLRYLLDQTSLD